MDNTTNDHAHSADSADSFAPCDTGAPMNPPRICLCDAAPRIAPDDYLGGFRVTCIECGCTGPLRQGSIRNAVHAWNDWTAECPLRAAKGGEINNEQDETGEDETGDWADAGEDDPS